VGASDRFDRSVSVVTFTKTTTASGSIGYSDVTAVSAYRCRIDPMSPRLVERVKALFGLEADPDMRYGMGDYDADVLAAMEDEDGCDVVDSSSEERYKVVGVHAQTGFGDPHHLFFVLRGQPYTA